MAKIYRGAEELIGNTPLVDISRFSRAKNAKATILAKLEGFNPAGSVKDRVALSMINDAEQRGTLKPGATIIEPTSGNTGIGLCAVAASRGYKAIIVMPDTMSVERQKIMRALGAEVMLTDGKLGMKGAINKAEELSREIPNSFVAGQFINPANLEVHRQTTGPEIYADTDGEVDIFVAGVGTGGTLTGVGEYLKSKNPDIKIVAVEPSDSPVLTNGRSGAHKLQGIGAGFIPKILNTEIYDEIITVSTEEAYESARLMGRTEGILVGISAGAALSAAAKLAARDENIGKTIVVLLADSGERYLSGELFE